MTQPSIELRGLEKSFGGFKAVKGIDIAVPRGAFLVLVGPSGCGKSTLLRMLAGLEAPSAGAIRFEGVEVANGKDGILRGPAARDCGLVFQSYALWPHMTLAGNIGWPLKVAGAGDAAARHARVGEVMRLLGIEHLAARYPNEISGGQQQRVAIARMVAPRPKILLFDEPLSNLDAKLRVEMRTELMRIHRATGATSVYVTHDQVEALTMASHVAVLKDGAVEQFGSPDELLAAPRTAFVAGFMGTPPANLVPVAAADGQDRFGDMALGPASGAAHVMYRAEQLGVAAVARERSIRVVVAESVPVAGRMMVTGLAGALRLSAVVDGMARVAIGETVHMVLPSVPAARFDATGARLP